MHKFIILFENATSGRVYGAVRFTSNDPKEYYNVDDYGLESYPISYLYNGKPVFLPGEL